MYVYMLLGGWVKLNLYTINMGQNLVAEPVTGVQIIQMLFLSQRNQMQVI